ncbi:hypothetical protein [Gottfriedia solisilvae]|uniref:hypothetical protein n=1 Tax=Gottfriedia solisilvae TaxID=1516104 RepID=UPI003D2EC9EB
MKIAIAMKSQFAFDRFASNFGSREDLKVIEVYKTNIKEMMDFEDVLEFFKPELIVIDTKLPNNLEMELAAKQQRIDIVKFESNFELTIEEVKRILKIGDNEPQEITSRKIDYMDRGKRPPEIIYKDRIIEKEIIKTAYSTVPNKLIAIGSLWSGAGATIFATNLARAIAKRGIDVAYVEHPLIKPYMFDYLLIHANEDGRGQKYTDFAQEIKINSFVRRTESWREYDISWYVNDSRKEHLQDFSYEEMLSFIYSINSTITIVDISNQLENPHLQKFLHHVDEVFICIEPDPIKTDWISTIYNDDENIVEASTQRNEKKVLDHLAELETKEGVQYQLISTKYTKEIDIKIWLDSLKMKLDKKPIAFLPNIPYEDVLKGIWESRLLYDDEEYNEIFEKVFKPILVKIIPREFYEIEKETKRSFFSKFVKKDN